MQLSVATAFAASGNCTISQRVTLCMLLGGHFPSPLLRGCRCMLLSLLCAQHPLLLMHHALRSFIDCLQGSRCCSALPVLGYQANTNSRSLLLGSWGCIVPPSWN